MTTSAIAALITPLLGRAVLATDKAGAETRYTISKLSDKVGTLKDGSKGEYVILTKDGETGVVMNLHPNTAKKLATKGEGDMLKLVPVADGAEPAASTEEAAAELNTDEQAAVAAELATEQAGGVTATEQTDAVAETPKADAAPVDEPAAEPAKAAKEPSKKDRTIAIFKSMAGSARKDIIAKMKTDLGLSDAGANTYYQNCKSGAWA